MLDVTHFLSLFFTVYARSCCQLWHCCAYVVWLLKIIRSYFYACHTSKLDYYQLAALKLVSLRLERSLEVTLDCVRQLHLDCEEVYIAVELHQGRAAGLTTFLWAQGVKGLDIHRH